MANKICSKCKKELDVSFFPKDSSKKDGLYPSCRECKKKKDYRYIQENKDAIYAKNQLYRDKNREKERKRLKKWRDENPEYYRKYMRNRLKTDMDFRIRHALRSRIWVALKRNKTNKKCKTSELVGTDIETLKEHLESQFVEGMSWENYGEWHIDHIKPCSLFDLTNESQQRECFHYSNLQPLWATDNLVKGNRYEQCLK